MRVLVEFVGNCCLVHEEDEIIEYNVDNLIDKYLLGDVLEVKKMLLNSKYFHEESTEDLLYKALKELIVKDFDELSSINMLLVSDFMFYYSNFNQYEKDMVLDETMEEILEGTPYKTLDKSIVGWHMLVALYIAYDYGWAMKDYCQRVIERNNLSENDRKVITSLISLQEIGISIVKRDGKMRRAYNIENMTSLVLLVLTKHFQNLKIRDESSYDQ